MFSQIDSDSDLATGLHTVFSAELPTGHENGASWLLLSGAEDGFNSIEATGCYPGVPLGIDEGSDYFVGGFIAELVVMGAHAMILLQP